MRKMIFILALLAVVVGMGWWDTNPTRIIFSGDTEKAHKLVPLARQVMFQLKTMMNAGLQQLRLKKDFLDGSFIHVSSAFGQDIVTIHAVSVQEEEVGQKRFENIFPAYNVHWNNNGVEENGYVIADWHTLAPLRYYRWDQVKLLPTARAGDVITMGNNSAPTQSWHSGDILYPGGLGGAILDYELWTNIWTTGWNIKKGDEIIFAGGGVKETEVMTGYWDNPSHILLHVLDTQTFEPYGEPFGQDFVAYFSLTDTGILFGRPGELQINTPILSSVSSKDTGLYGFVGTRFYIGYAASGYWEKIIDGPLDPSWQHNVVQASGTMNTKIFVNTDAVDIFSLSETSDADTQYNWGPSNESGHSIVSANGQTIWPAQTEIFKKDFNSSDEGGGNRVYNSPNEVLFVCYYVNDVSGSIDYFPNPDVSTLSSFKSAFTYSMAVASHGNKQYYVKRAYPYVHTVDVGGRSYQPYYSMSVVQIPDEIEVVT